MTRMPKANYTRVGEDLIILSKRSVSCYGSDQSGLVHEKWNNLILPGKDVENEKEREKVEARGRRRQPHDGGARNDDLSLSLSQSSRGGGLSCTGSQW